MIRADKQVEGFDFTETSASIEKMKSVWCFLDVAAGRVGNCIKFMSIMPSCMEISMRRYT